MVYLFLGQDSLSKDEQLKAIRQSSLTAGTQEQFNQDVLYGKECVLTQLQEAFLRIPAAGANSRLIVVKQAQALDEPSKKFLLNYAAKPTTNITLIVDIDSTGKSDEFVNRLSRQSKVFRFKQDYLPDTFTLARSISSGLSAQALKLLDQLLKNGEKPERILGGLRYAWEKDTLPAAQSLNRLKLLVKCDIEIKTGRLKPVFALEKLVVGLCRAGKPL